MTAPPSLAGPHDASAPRDASLGVQTLLAEFPCDLPIGVELGVMRALAATPVTRLLMHSGGYATRGRERHAAVLGAIFVVLQNGLDHPASQVVYRRIRSVHAQHHVPDALVLYAMAGMVSGLIDWTDRHAWRRLTAEEQQTWGAFWTGLADRVGLSRPPRTTVQWREYLERQEAVWFGDCDDNARLAAIMREIFAQRVWPVARPLARWTFRALIPAEVLPHVGWRALNPWERRLIDGVLCCRGTLGRAFPEMRHSGRVLLEQLN